MKKLIISAFLTAMSVTCFSQSSLYVSAGANFFITPGTSVYIDGLLIKPSVNFNINGLNSLTRDGTATPPPPTPNILRVFHFLQTTSVFSGDISFYYQDADLNGLDENTLNLSIYDGTTWLPYIPSQRDLVNNFVNRLGIAAVALNELTLTAPGAALPVTLSRFTGQKNDCTAILSWSTASEQNSKHFEVLQSFDGVNFSLITIIPSSGNSTTEKQYSYNANLTGPNDFFRLRMVDNDGQSKLSSILKFTSNCNYNSIAVYPNPTQNMITVSGLHGISQLRILDQQGRIVSLFSTSNTNEKIDLLRFAAGSYIVQVLQNNTVVKSINIIKE